MSIVNDHGITHVGTVRKNNEDAILSYSNAGLWAVADGMGGHEAGDYASQCIIDLLSDIGDQYKGITLVDQIKQTLTRAHHTIFEHSQTIVDQPVIGTTIVVLVMEADNYHCFWTGDSRCYLLREKALHALTTDHTEAQQLLQSGSYNHALSDEEKIRAENTLVHAIGIDSDLPHIDYATGYLYENDRFLLCSDGVNKVYSDDELSDRLDMDNIEKINQSILNDALNTHAPDNLSSIIISI